MSRRLVVDDGRTARELLLVGTMVVGRDPDCEISHRDPRLSRRHAEFTVGDDGIIVRDLDSRNGIRVNGSPVKEAVLRPGDLVQIAQLTVRFVDDEELAARTTAVARPAHSAVTVAAAVEDDRTRVVPSGTYRVTAAQAALATLVTGATPVAQAADDRTRVAAPPAAPVRASVPADPDLGQVVFRDPPAAPPGDPLPDGLGSLMTASWGRRVLLQGLMLALVVFLMSTVPLLVWQSQQFGVTAAQSLVALAPPLLAAGAAGVLVASLIARTTARGLERDGRPRPR
jgi:hypothetical protein